MNKNTPKPEDYLDSDAVEEALKASLENMGAPDISSCKVIDGQVYFYDSNGYLSMIIPEDALEEFASKNIK